MRPPRTTLVLPAMVVGLGGACAWLILAKVVLGGPSLRFAAACLSILVPMAWLFCRYFAWRSTMVSLTTDRLVVAEGILRRRVDQIRLERVVEVHRRRTLRDRLTRRGDLVIELVDASPVVLAGIRRPEAFQRLLLRHVATDLGSFVDDDSRQSDRERPDRGWSARSGLLVVTEDDPTPPRGTPAITGGRAAVLLARLDEVDQLELTGALSSAEADRRRRELTDGG